MANIPHSALYHSKRRDPRSFLLDVTGGVGGRADYPSSGHAKLDNDEAMALKQMGLVEAVELAETATGHILPIVIEENVNSGTRHTKMLGMKREDGTPAYMYAADYLALPAERRELMKVEKKRRGPPTPERQMAQELADLRAKVAAMESEKPAAGRESRRG